MRAGTKDLRRLLAQMPPKYHDRDPAKSEVLAHICATAGLLVPEAKLAFHRLRKANVLVFTMPARTWSGYAYRAALNESEFRDHVLARLEAANAQINALRRRCDAQDKTIAKLKASNNSLVAAVRSLRSESDKPSSEPDKLGLCEGAVCTEAQGHAGATLGPSAKWHSGP